MRFLVVLLSVLVLIVVALAVLFFLPKERQLLIQSQSAIDPEVFFVWDETKRLYKIEPIGLETLSHGPFTLYFPSQYQTQAEEVAQALAHSWQVVQRRLGLDLGAFAVVLVLLREDMGGVFIESWPVKPVPQPLVSSMKWTRFSEAPRPTQLMVYGVFPHEAVHLALRWEEHWLEEGLADYVGLLVVQELAPDLCATYREGRQETVRAILPQVAYYDLTQEPPQQFVIREQVRLKTSSPEEEAGYGVSLAFWLQIAHNHGEEVIRRFLEQARQLQHTSSQELARVLSELTGEDIWSKLQRMNLHEALQTFEKICEENAPTAP